MPKQAGTGRQGGRQDGPSAHPAAFRRSLHRWYETARRDLPWRRTSDPYAIWVSETMLQQTRVEVVAERFAAFLRAFPDLGALARADEEAVLALWSGLGYYARARRLRQGAALVAERFQGRFPRDLEAAGAIPGVGPYTARAVLSIAFGEPLAVVDGNVARVLARLEKLEPPSDRSASRLADLAGTLLDRRRPGLHNQAMMELGALVCIPGSPRCGQCPVSGFCRAGRDGVASRYPSPRPRPEPVEVVCTLLLLRDSHGRLLVERERWRLLPHLWLPPTVEQGTTLAKAWQERRLAPGGWRRLREAGSFHHTITRHRLTFRVLTGRAAGSPGPGRGTWPPTGMRLIDDEGLAGIGRSAVLQKALGLEKEGSGPGRQSAGKPGRRAGPRAGTPR